MPVTPTYSWSQTIDQVDIRVKLPGLTRQKPDIFVTDVLVKVVAHPYVLLLDLHAAIDSDNGAAYATPGDIVFKLPKREPCTWGTLVYNGSKAASEERRHLSIEAAHAAAEEHRRRHVERLAHEKKMCIDRQIEVDKRKRQTIESAKASELDAEVECLNQWKLALNEQAYNEEAESESSETSATVGHPGTEKEQFRPYPTSQQHWQEQSTSQSCGHGMVGPSGGGEHETSSSDAELDKALPSTMCRIPFALPPRNMIKRVEVNFTKLEFPHLPARENREAELRLYKQAQADASQVSNSAEMADKQPAFLKDKADALHSQRNFHAAINAYSAALEREESDSELSLTCRLNRAACYSRIACLAECISDCGLVLSTIHTAEGIAVEGSDVYNGKWKTLKIKALTRRSAAYAQQGSMQQAHEDCHSALKLDPMNKQLLSLCAELNGPGGVQCAISIQKRANARFESGQYGAAADAFSALETIHKQDPVKLATALSNKAMCKLCLHQFDKAFEACQAAFTCAAETSALPQGPVENVLELLSDKLCLPEVAPVIMKCVGRMATCVAHMKEFIEAERLYTIAAGIAQGIGNNAAAGVFVADAKQMRSLADVQP